MAKLVQTPRLNPSPEELEKQQQQKTLFKNNKQGGIRRDLVSQVPSYDNFKIFIESILASNNYEEILTATVEQLLKDEQMALTPQTKEAVKYKKILLGSVFNDVVAYGDQQGLLYILSDRLGYRRKY